MGWTWALFMCQRLHERAVERAGLTAAQRVQDGQPPPSLARVAHLQYVDNFAALGVDPEKAVASLDSVVKELDRLGLEMHKEEVTTEDTQILGWHIEGDEAVLRPTAKGCGGRAW